MAPAMGAVMVAVLAVAALLSVADARSGRALLQGRGLLESCPESTSSCYTASGNSAYCCPSGFSCYSSDSFACYPASGSYPSDKSTVTTNGFAPGKASSEMSSSETSSPATSAPATSAPVTSAPATASSTSSTTSTSNGTASTAPKAAGVRTITVHNDCPDTLWLAAYTTPGHSQISEPASPVLSPGQSASYFADSNWIGRIWARTKCSGDPFRCATGDCGGYHCNQGLTGELPATLAEFAMAQWAGLDFYDVSLVDGFNVPMQIAPTQSSCVTCGCNSNIVTAGGCPPELQQKNAAGEVVGCYSACSAPSLQKSPDLDKFCCVGKYIDADACIAVHPDAYTTAHKNHCPLAYSYAYDDANKSLFGCAGTDYDIYLCGGPGLTKL